MSLSEPRLSTRSRCPRPERIPASVAERLISGVPSSAGTASIEVDASACDTTAATTVVVGVTTTPAGDEQLPMPFAAV